MNYKRFISSSKINFEISDHLIECGGAAWQIRNIAATSIGKEIIQNNQPEPRFMQDEPKIEDLGSLVGGLIVSIIIAWVVIGCSQRPLAIMIAIVILGIPSFVIFWVVQQKNEKKEQWLEEKARTQKKWEKWNEIRNNPLVVYSLMLETNAGSKPLFYSLDESQIIRANNAIKKAMEKRDTSDIKFEIESVNIGGAGSINNYGSSIYNQAIQGA